MKKIKLHGLHAHIGSQILDIKPFVEEAKLLVELSLKYGTREINIGGGIGIAYLPDQIQPDIEKFAGEIDAVLKGKDDLKLIIEPGRSIVGKAGVTLYSVGAVKEIPGVRKYVVVDGGMADNSRPILYDARYDACLANKPESPLVDNVRVAGRYCESGDILINEIMLPKVEAGDLLVMSCTGAYTYSMASNYNRVVRPAMVLVNSGSASIILKRESYKDLLSNDVI
jgi:diaminopimelate decarboxylase